MKESWADPGHLTTMLVKLNKIKQYTIYISTSFFIGNNKSVSLWKVVNMYLRLATATACMLMAWNPFRQMKVGSSSPAMPWMGTSVPSMAPTTFGNPCMLKNSSFTFFSSCWDVGNLILSRQRQSAEHTIWMILEAEDKEIPCVSATSER